MLLPFAEPQRGASDNAALRGDKPKWADVFGLLRIPNYLLVVLGYTAYTFALGAFALWGPPFLSRVHHIAVENAATFFGSVLVVAGLIGTLVGGFIASAWQKYDRAGYAFTLGLSVLLAVPVAALAFLFQARTPAMLCLAAAMFLLFLITGPVNTLILETVPANLRASAMALSIFMIHLGGDMWSPELVGRLSDTLADRFALANTTGMSPEILRSAAEAHGLKRAVLILPVALALAAVFWLVLAVRMRQPVARQSTAP